MSKTQAIAPVAAPVHVAATLLELMQAMDGKREARYNVAVDALTAAYTQAMTYGDKRQLNGMLTSKGKGKCVVTMRDAIQQAGVLGLYKDDSTRADAIAAAVAIASTVFFEGACQPKAKPVKAVKEAAPAEAAVKGEGDGTQEGEGAAPTPATPATTLDNATVALYARTLSSAQLADLLDVLSAIVAEKAEPLLRAA